MADPIFFVVGDLLIEGGLFNYEQLSDNIMKLEWNSIEKNDSTTRYKRFVIFF